MEQAEKGLEKAQPRLEEADEAMDKGAEATIFGLEKYEEFQDDYKSRRDNANPDDYRKYPFETAIVEYKLEGKVEGEKSYYVYGAGYKMAEYMIEDMDYTEFKAFVKKEDPTMTDSEIQQAYLYLKQKSKMRK